MSRLFFDIGKPSPPPSGLTRVGQALLHGLEQAGTDVQPVYWHKRKAAFLDATHTKPLQARVEDYLLTSQVFSEAERPGFTAWLETTPLHTCALYHDAIPLKHPEFTWPHSVRRHPAYLKSLAHFRQVFAVSEAAAEELRAYWAWLGLNKAPPIAAVPSGADAFSPERLSPRIPIGTPLLLQVGILEPRKGQLVTLTACKQLWDEGLRFELHLAGRVNPHFGKPIFRQFKALQRVGYDFPYHCKANDTTLSDLYRRAHLSLFPSLAEGNGLPVLESLWMGTPVVATPVPAATEWAQGHGIALIATPAALAQTLRHLLSNPEALATLTNATAQAPLLNWTTAATQLTRLGQSIAGR